MRSKGTKDLTDNQVKLLLKLFGGGKSVKEISVQTGIADRTIYQRVKKLRDELKRKFLLNLKERLEKIDGFNRGYLLGIIDGEGCISIGEHINTPTKPRFFAHLDIVNTNKEIINKVSKIISPDYVRIRKFDRIGWNNIYVYRIYDKEVLEVVLDFLIREKRWIKREQAKVVLNFIKSKSEQMKRDYKEQISKLNKRGDKNGSHR